MKNALSGRLNVENWLSTCKQHNNSIIDYPVKANDEDYWFLTRKAIYYQNMINKLDEQLNADDN